MVVSGKRVLVVDDDWVVRESFKRVLTDAGYSVTTARSGRAALAACSSEPFDVMLADLKMPEMDGLEVTRMVKREHPQVQVLIVTGYPTQQSAKEARGLGVFDYLNKPVTPDRLNAVTAAALAAPVPRMTPTVPEVAQVPEEAAQPVAPAAAPAARQDEVEAETASPQSPENVLKTLAVLTLGPLLGLAFVMLLPIIGFGMLLVVLAGGLTEKLGRVKA
jgi:CheY-like chemotaxis protein